MGRPREMFSAAQCRAARGLLGWEVERLAQAARLDPEAVELYEAGDGELAASELAMLGGAFVRAGVIAVPSAAAGEGVRFAWPPAGRPVSPRTGFAEGVSANAG